eukprot:198305-Karenia_brevis.AAC.1
MFGNEVHKGNIRNYGMLKKLFAENADEDPNASLSLSSLQQLYGSAVASDPSFAESFVRMGAAC